MSNSIELRKPKGSGQPAQTSQPQVHPSPDLEQAYRYRARAEVANALDKGGAPAAQGTSHLTCRQLAERWSCCEYTIRRRKDLKPLRFNRRLIRYRLQDILAIETAARS